MNIPRFNVFSFTKSLQQRLVFKRDFVRQKDDDKDKAIMKISTLKEDDYFRRLDQERMEQLRVQIEAEIHFFEIKIKDLEKTMKYYKEKIQDLKGKMTKISEEDDS